MKLINLLFLIFIVTFSSCKKEITTVETTSLEKTTYYFIRHAEKDRSNPEDNNPSLTDIGEQRAKNWSNIFKHIKFDAVFSTNYKRTLATAKPIANRQGLEITIYNPKDLDLSSFKKETEGKTVLIVGHSNSTPNFVNKLIGSEKYQEINDNQFGNLFIVTKNNEDLSAQLLVIN